MKYLSLFLYFLSIQAYSQSYTSYFTGDTADVATNPQAGVVLMGGGGESDPAMIWFLERADGGDVLVIRASGSDGYNDYMFSELGVTVNSVETIVFHDASAAADPYVLTRLEQAEALWIAGGDQWDYVSFWKDTGVEELIQYLIDEKGIPIGGISAGMAVLGDAYFSAQLGTVTSDEALNDPYDEHVQLGYHDFIQHPLMAGIITDTHFDSPDRRGRLITFLARLMVDQGILPVGIACEEFAAVCIDGSGLATVYGEYPEYEDLVYFLQVKCDEPNLPGICSPGQQLDWDHAPLTVHATVLAGTSSGTSAIDLTNMQEVTGPVFAYQNWSVESGTLVVENYDGPYGCDTILDLPEAVEADARLFPNPANDVILASLMPGWYQIYRSDGVWMESFYAGKETYWLDIATYPAGFYFITSASFSAAFLKLE